MFSFLESVGILIQLGAPVFTIFDFSFLSMFNYPAMYILP